MRAFGIILYNPLFCPAPAAFPLVMIKWLNRWLSLSGCALLALGLAAEARGAGEADTRLRLEREFEQEGRAREDQLLEDAEALDGPPETLELDGQTYSIGDSAHDVGRALYLAIQRQDWPGAARFLEVYLRFEDRDLMLVAYAEGGLARAAGDLDEAEARYHELLELQDDFLPGQLELARVLFEHRKDKEARRAFERLRVRFKAQGEQAAGVLRTVEAFLGALRERRGPPWRWVRATTTTSTSPRPAAPACWPRPMASACWSGRSPPLLRRWAAISKAAPDCGGR